ncbi:hypothetical protein [Tardiphaga sp.]|nr:hypothetical protein [Tardiphaga sp.]
MRISRGCACNATVTRDGIKAPRRRFDPYMNAATAMAMTPDRIIRGFLD